MRRVARGIARFLAWLLVAVVVLVFAVAAAIQLPPVRGFIRDQVLAAARGSVNGEIELDDVRWPMPSHLELSGLTLRDRTGRRVAGLSTLTVKVELPSLNAGQVRLPSVVVSDLYLDFSDFGERTGLLSLFATDKPRAAPKDPNAAVSPIAVVIESLCLERAELHMAPADEQAFALEQLHGCVRLRAHQSLYVAADSLQGRVLRNKVPVALLQLEPELPEPEQAVGAPRMLASVRGQLQLGGGAMAYDAWVRARGLSPGTLRALGLENDVLQRELNLDVHVRGADKRTSYRALVRSEAGSVEASGALDEQSVLTARLFSAGLQADKITSLALPKAGFEVNARASLADSAKTTLQAALERGYYGSFALPKVELQALREKSGALVVERMTASYSDAVVRGAGRLGANGALTAQLQVAIDELGNLPPLRASGASAQGDVRLSADVGRGADDLWRVKLSGSSRTLAVGSTQLRKLSLEGQASGDLARPRLQLDVRADALAAGERAFSQLRLALAGGPERYQLHAEADEQKLRADGWVQPSGPAWDGALDLRAQLPEGSAVARIGGLRLVPGESLKMSDTVASFLGARLSLDAALDLQGGHSKVRLAVDVPALDKLLTAFGQKPIAGRIALRGALRGELQRPAADVTVRLTQGPAFAGEPSQAKLELHADAARGRSLLQLGAGAGKARVDSQVKSTWSRTLPLSAALKAARHSAEVELRDVPLANLLDPESPLPSRVVDGPIRGKLSAQGNLEKVQIAAELSSRLRASRERQSVDVAVKLGYQNAQAQLSVDAGDARGQLLTLRASSQVSLEEQLKRPLDARELLTAKSWEVTAELAERQLGELPLISSLGLDEQLAPLRVGLHAQVGHAPRSEPDGTFEAQLRWEPPRTLRRASAICTDRASGRALLAAKWAQERLGVELSGGARSDDTVKVSARTRLLFSELLAGRVRELAGFQLAAKLQDLNLQDVPVACRYGSGRVSLDARARDVFSPTADVELSLQSKGVSWQGSPPLDVDLRARSTDRAMRVAGKLGTAAGQLSLDGLLPVDVHVAQPSGMVRRNDPTQVDLRLSHMPMASLLAFVPGVARVSGTTTGELSVRGSVQAPVLAGKLELDDVSLTIPRLGQRFSHLHLQATVDGSTVRLSEGRVKDLDGSASIAALLKLRSLDEWRAEINLNTRNFPLRKTGLILGRVDATAHIAAAMTRERTQVDVTLNDVAIALSSEDVGSVQSLDPHPEFSFVDARVTDSPAEPEEPVEPVEREKSAIPTVIRLISKDGVWVRRDDFAVEMQTDLTITLGQAKPLLHGEIKLLRGYLSLFGQSFDIERGRVVLGGGEKVDPQLEITATHDTPGGSSVRVEVTGFASEPQLAFFVADKAVTARDALIAITGGGRTNTSARGPEQEIAAAAVGMTTGLLTLGARREFGDWVPMLAIEQGAGTRVRVGVDADQFIPSFLKGFVRGAYVEGIVSTQNDASGRTATPSSTASTSAMSASGTGVLLELMLPSHFVWAGQYGPGQAWSIDLDWRP